MVVTNPTEQQESFDTRFDLEYREFVEEVARELEQELRDLSNLNPGLSTESEDIGTKIEERRQHLLNLGFERRVSEMTNNFFLNWPGGWGRDLLAKGYSDGNICANPRFVTDLDTIIVERGYESRIPLVLDNKTKLDDETYRERMTIIADVYLEMRARGWERYPITA